MSGKRILVSYYSRTGNSKKVAERLAELLECDIQQIIDKKNRKGIIGYIKSGRDAVLEKTTDIVESKTDFSNYEAIILITPVWASNMTCAMRTYIQKYGDAFNKVAFICTQMGSGYEKAVHNMEQLLGKKAITSSCINSKDIKRNRYEDEIIKFINDFKI